MRGKEGCYYVGYVPFGDHGRALLVPMAGGTLYLVV